MQPQAHAAARQAADFFRRVGQASGNPVLMISHEPLLQLLEPSLQAMIDQVPQARARIANAQKKILDALQARDVESARTWAAKHIRDYRRGFDVAAVDVSHVVRLG
jgi:DNA-binding FadR family transcriptional regulator